MNNNQQIINSITNNNQIKQKIIRKQSHKKSNQNLNQTTPNQTTNQPSQPLQAQTQQPSQQTHQKIKKNISHKAKSKSIGGNCVSFNIKKNQVDKFYCPQMILSKVTKTGLIDLESIQDLPEIPLDSLFGNQ
jgi:hypothetical protein